MSFDNQAPVRLEKIRRSLRQADGLLVTNMNNVRYISGFTGSAGFALVSKKEKIFATDFRYKEQALKELSGWDVLPLKKDRFRSIETLAAKLGIKKLGFETTVSYEFFRKLSATGIKLRPVKGLIEKSRAEKDASEIAAIREAVGRAEKAFSEVRPFIRAGVRERALALRLEERLKKKGSRRLPFDIIVASGANSALPHAKVSDKKLAPGDLVVIDWGAESGGYFSDMTRTLLVSGRNLSKKKEIYMLVYEANSKAIRSVSRGVRAKDIDNSARDVIKKGGYGGFFGHGLGHGVGIEVHEQPAITWNTETLIKEGMVFTIEPGIYVPNVGGVRIEDMVVVRENGAEVMTKLPKTLRQNTV